MKKIVIRFNSISKVQKLKKIMKKVSSKDNDQIKDIAKFTLKKNVIPQNVDHAEIAIATKHDSRIINIAREDLSFLYGDKLPFTRVSNEGTTMEQYVILPWNLNNPAGKTILNDIISNISSKTRSLTYTIYVTLPETDTIAHNIEEETSIDNLSLSELSYGGEMEQLLDRIEMLEHDLLRVEDNLYENEQLLNQRQERIDTLSNQLSQKTTQANNLNTQLQQSRARVNNLNTQATQRQNQINSLNSQLGSRSSQVSNLQNQVNNANRTPRITVNAGGVTMSGSRTNGSFGFNNALVSFDFNNRTINVTSPNFEQTHSTLI